MLNLPLQSFEHIVSWRSKLPNDGALKPLTIRQSCRVILAVQSLRKERSFVYT